MMKRTFIKTAIFVFMPLIFALNLCSCGKKPSKSEKRVVIARIDGTEITSDELKTRIPPEFSKRMTKEQWLQIVGNLIDEQLLVEYARRSGAADDAEVKRQIAEAERQIMIEFLRQKVLGTMITVTDEEIERYYFANQADFVRPKEEIDALHILTKTKEIADTIKALLDKDTPFGEVARKYSIELSPSDSCDLGWFSRDDILPELAQPLFKALPGEYVGPIKLGEDFHFFLIVDKQEEGTVRSLEEVKDEIRRRLMSTKFNEKINTLLDSLRIETEIAIDTAAIDSLISLESG